MQSNSFKVMTFRRDRDSYIIYIYIYIDIYRYLHFRQTDRAEALADDEGLKALRSA